MNNLNTVTHIFFDLHGTLIDGHNLHLCYSTQLGHYMAARYGGIAEAWRDANRAIVKDWDSYYADLDLDGENSVDHMWEGYYRTTRALFRITNTPEPSHSELTALVRELPFHATVKCDEVYPDARIVIEQLHHAGYVLGVASHAIQVHARGLLTGGRIEHFFTGAIVGTDETPTFDKGEQYYTHVLHKSGVKAENCLIVDDKAHFLQAAHRVRLKTAHISRETQPEQKIGIDLYLHPDLSGLIPALIL